VDIDPVARDGEGPVFLIECSGRLLPVSRGPRGPPSMYVCCDE
jgi:hypothetical protein